MTPRLEAAQAGQGQVFFVDASHFVFGTFLCCLWSVARIFVRAASGRQRFNVLGAWNAVTRQLTYVTNTTVVNTQTMCQPDLFTPLDTVASPRNEVTFLAGTGVKTRQGASRTDTTPLPPSA